MNDEKEVKGCLNDGRGLLATLGDLIDPGNGPNQTLSQLEVTPDTPPRLKIVKRPVDNLIKDLPIITSVELDSTGGISIKADNVYHNETTVTSLPSTAGDSGYSCDRTTCDPRPSEPESSQYTDMTRVLFLPVEEDDLRGFKHRGLVNSYVDLWMKGMNLEPFVENIINEDDIGRQMMEQLLTELWNSEYNDNGTSNITEVFLKAAKFRMMENAKSWADNNEE